MAKTRPSDKGLSWPHAPAWHRQVRRSAHAKAHQKSKERALRSGLFDADWYLANYPEVATAGHDPFSHYVSIGAAEGRDPGPNFSTLRYLQRYPDLARAGVNPLLHYLEFGMREEREIFPAETATQDYHAWIAAA